MTLTLKPGPNPNHTMLAAVSCGVLRCPAASCQDRRGFTGTTETLKRKFFGNVKKCQAKCERSCTLFALRCQEKPSGVYKMQETAWAAGALPRLAAPPQEPNPWSRPFRPRASALACAQPLIFKPLWTKILTMALRPMVSFGFQTNQ